MSAHLFSAVVTGAHILDCSRGTAALLSWLTEATHGGMAISWFTAVTGASIATWCWSQAIRVSTLLSDS